MVVFYLWCEEVTQYYHNYETGNTMRKKVPKIGEDEKDFTFSFHLS